MMPQSTGQRSAYSRVEVTAAIRFITFPLTYFGQALKDRPTDLVQAAEWPSYLIGLNVPYFHYISIQGLTGHIIKVIWRQLPSALYYTILTFDLLIFGLEFMCIFGAEKCYQVCLKENVIPDVLIHDP